MNKIKQFFDLNKEYIKKYDLLAEEVLAIESNIKSLSDEELKAKTEFFKEEIKNGKTLESIQVEAFAVVREASTRVAKMTPFKVQIMGAFALVEGNIAEMKTGEGKTLTSTMPAYTLALLGEGVHIITVNDYLAHRDATEMGEIFNFLGLTVGLNKRENSNDEKRDSYLADITYSTNSELGFDYLRDNMVMRKEERVQRGLKYAIIDEVDSILIDESRTPLIISGAEKKTHNMYRQIDSLVKSFVENKDYRINVKDKTAHILPEGISKTEISLNLKNLYDVENSQVTHSINQSLKANFIMRKDFDYVVKEAKVVIVDQFTGRTMEGRSFSDGLHQAIESKENVQTNKETKTMATITYQNFFRLYNQLSGMTGTAKTEEEEFVKTYDMDVVTVPTNVDIIRNDKEDMIFANKNAKYKFAMSYIKERHEVGQPILIGTVAIETSEEISRVLTANKIKHQVLNAKNHEQEAHIIEQAGKFGTVTIATNMAGRGTDIKLENKVKEIGDFESQLTGKTENASGLLIVGTERHESRRIDNQLRGRSGRQGDPGESIFFVSFEDDLLRRYSSERTRSMLEKLGLKNEPISNKQLTKQVAKSQIQVESIFYDVRKSLLKYDDVLREQREIMYAQRDYIINSENLIQETTDIIKRYVVEAINYYLELNDHEGLKEMVNIDLTRDEIRYTKGKEEDEITKYVLDEFNGKVSEHGEDVITGFSKSVMLKVIDEHWINHIDEMQVLRESIGLRSYGQIDPLIEYQRDGRIMFEDMIDEIEKDIVIYIAKGRIQTKAEREAMLAKLKAEHDSKLKIKVASTTSQEPKVGRNDECPCGSGKKYKNCHGA